MAGAVKIIEGLKILLKYYPNAEVDAQHDVLLAGGPKPDQIKDEDRQELKNLGWSYSISEESWRRFT